MINKLKHKKAVLTLMPFIILLLYFCARSLSTSARQYAPGDFTHYKIGCEIYTLDFQIERKFNGYYCLFLSDGTYVALNDNNIIYYSNYNQQLWKRDVETHHHGELSPDGKTIYYLGNSYHDFRGLKVRFDTIEALDLKTGKTLALWDAYNYADLLEQRSSWRYNKDRQINSWSMHKDRAPYEFMHFNSIAFVPSNDLEKKYNELAPGNLIVSAGVSLVLFFDPKLNLIQTMTLDKSQGTNFHDTQITSEGELLVYRNMSNDYPYTKLQVLTYPELKETWVYPRPTDKIKFHSFACGSVQIIENNNILFSDISNGGRFFEITRDGDVLKDHFNSDIDPQTNRPKDIFKIKKVDLAQFMKQNFYQGP